MLTVMKHVSDQGTAQVCWRDRIDVLNIQVDEPVGRESIFLYSHSCSWLSTMFDDETRKENVTVMAPT